MHADALRTTPYSNWRRTRVNRGGGRLDSRASRPHRPKIEAFQVIGRPFQHSSVVPCGRSCGTTWPLNGGFVATRRGILTYDLRIPDAGQYPHLAPRRSRCPMSSAKTRLTRCVHVIVCKPLPATSLLHCATPICCIRTPRHDLPLRHQP
jgi:hypothetical protein